MAFLVNREITSHKQSIRAASSKKHPSASRERRKGARRVQPFVGACHLALCDPILRLPPRAAVVSGSGWFAL